jgi:hypothetical protein
VNNYFTWKGMLDLITVCGSIIPELGSIIISSQFPGDGNDSDDICPEITLREPLP